MNTQVAKVNKGDADVPDYLRDYALPNDGSDNFDANDVMLPKIKLLQGLSKEVEAFDDAKSGHFWHTGLDMDLGPEIVFVVADRRKKYLLSAPIEDGQGVLARADDFKTWDRTGSWQVKLKGVKQPVTWSIEDTNVEASGLAEWGTYNPEDEDSPPAATLFYEYLVFLPEHIDLGPCVLSLARTQIKNAKRGLNDKIAFHKNNGRPVQALSFKASSYADSADGQDFKNMKFTSAGFNKDESLFELAVQHSGALANIRVQDEVEDAEASTKSGPADDGGKEF